MIARRLLPASPSSLLDRQDRAITSARPQSVSRHVGRTRRRNHDGRAPRTGGLVKADRIGGGIRRHLSVSNSWSGRHWELDQGPAVGDRTDIVQLGTGHPCGRRRRSTACGPSTTRGCVPRGRRPDARRHATVPQAWMQREYWEFETHRSLRLLVHEYVAHDHRERHHQGLDNQLLQRPPTPVRSDADVQRRGRLGGLLSFYYREAA